MTSRRTICSRWSSRREAACPNHIHLAADGIDAVDRWFTEQEVEDVLALANRMAV